MPPSRTGAGQVHQPAVAQHVQDEEPEREDDRHLKDGDETEIGESPNERQRVQGVHRAQRGHDCQQAEGDAGDHSSHGRRRELSIRESQRCRHPALSVVAHALALIGCKAAVAPVIPEDLAAPPEIVEPQPEPEPERVVVSLHVDRPDEPEAAASLRQATRQASGDDAGSGGIHSSVTTMQEGESFRLMVRFTGTVPVAGTCTITLADSGGHTMADATATLASCDLGDVA